MKATGVVRRIDDLGRIVIPKEIRKTLRVKDGESLEIFLDNENIVLKKYQPLEGISDFYKSYVDTIHSTIGCNVIIVDRDCFVAIAGDIKKKYLGNVISSFLDNIIQSRTNVIEFEEKEIFLLEDTSEMASYVIAPIISEGEAIGAVIILATDKKLDEFEEKTATIAAKFLGKYIES